MRAILIYVHFPHIGKFGHIYFFLHLNLYNMSPLESKLRTATILNVWLFILLCPPPFYYWFLPVAGTAASDGPAGSGWHLYGPDSPCSCSETSLPGSTAPSHLHPPGSIWIQIHTITFDVHAVDIYLLYLYICSQTMRKRIPKVILHFSDHVQQDLQAVPPHPTALLMEVKGYVPTENHLPKV